MGRLLFDDLFAHLKTGVELSDDLLAAFKTPVEVFERLFGGADQYVELSGTHQSAAFRLNEEAASCVVEEIMVIEGFRFSPGEPVKPVEAFDEVG